MLSITDLKNGTKFVYENDPYVVLSYSQSKMGRGGSVVKVRIKNLVNGNVLEKTFQGADKLEPADITKSKAQYLYRDESNAFFMNLTSFEQFEIPLTQIGSLVDYLKENSKVDILYSNQRAINIELPIKMKFEVKEAPPSVKGNSQGGVFKKVKIETGASIDTPLFISVGDKIIVDTRNGAYVERAN